MALSIYWVIEERQGETWQPALKRPIAHEPLAQRCIQRLRTA